jgi:curved DNA-binding protein CbpA
MTLYSVLGIPRGAPTPVIKKAFRKLARALHPDKAPATEPPAARLAREEEFKNVAAAYEILSNPTTRRVYDKSLR